MAMNHWLRRNEKMRRQINRSRDTAVMRSTILLLAALAVAGCEALPAAGPTGLEIKTEAKQTAENDAPAFTLVEVTDVTARTLEARPQPDFSDIFTQNGDGASFRIHAGDVVTVTLWESVSAGISGGLFRAGGPGAGSGSAAVQMPDQVVGPGGRISIPFAGRVLVRGRTPAQVERDIVARLEDKAINPQAIVSVTKTASNKVTVIGDAVTGGSVDLAAGADRITDAIALSGGLNGVIDDALITLTREGVSSTMPLARIFQKPSQNLRLNPGDILTLESQPNSFIAVGATSINARLPFGNRPYFLSDALGAVGGVLDSRGDPAAVYVLRIEDPVFAANTYRAEPLKGDGAPIAYLFDLDLAASFFLTRRFAMQDKDIIYVANAPTVELQKLLDIFRATTGTALALNTTGVFGNQR